MGNEEQKYAKTGLKNQYNKILLANKKCQVSKNKEQRQKRSKKVTKEDNFPATLKKRLNTNPTLVSIVTKDSPQLKKNTNEKIYKNGLQKLKNQISKVIIANQNLLNAKKEPEISEAHKRKKNANDRLDTIKENLLKCPQFHDKFKPKIDQ